MKSEFPAQLGGRRLDIEPVHGGVVSLVESFTEQAVLWGELIKDNERNLLKSELHTTIVRLMLRETYQMFAKVLWQPEVKSFKGPGYRPGRTAVLLHTTERRTSNGWAWLKLARPLFLRGFNVVAIDFPGFGGSCINNIRDVKEEQWRHSGGQILLECMNELCIDRANFIAEGTACEFVVYIATHMPRRLGVHHVFHNPVVNLNVLFPENNLDLQHIPGMPWKAWLRILLQGQLVEMEKTFRRAEITVYSTFDETASPGALDTLAIMKELREATVRMMSRLSIEHVTSKHIVDAQVGASVPVRIFVLSRWLRDRFADFISSGLLDFEERPSERLGSSESQGFDHSPAASLPSRSPLPARQRSPPHGQRTPQPFRSASAESNDTEASATRGPRRQQTLTPTGRSASPTALGADMITPKRRQRSLGISHSDSSLRPMDSPPKADRTLTPTHLKPATPPSRPSTRGSSSEVSPVSLPVWHLRNLKGLQTDPGPEMYRRHLISRVPREWHQVDLERYRTPMTLEPNMKQEEIDQLQDGLDASLNAYVMQLPRAIGRGAGHRPVTGVSRPGTSLSVGFEPLPQVDKTTRTTARRRENWKAFSKTFKSFTSETMPLDRAMRSGDLASR